MAPYAWWSGFPWMWIFPVMFFLAIIFMVFFFTLFLRGGGGPFWRQHGRNNELRKTPRQILDRRYAGGEITKEQYEEMKRNLER